MHTEPHYNRRKFTSIIALAVLLGSECHSQSLNDKIRPLSDLKLSLKSEKAAYAQGSSFYLTPTLRNDVWVDALVIFAHEDFVITRDGHPFTIKDGAPNDRTFWFDRELQILDFEKSIGWGVRPFNSGDLPPGTYEVKLRQFFKVPVKIPDAPPKLGTNFLEASTSFRIVKAEQSDGSTANPSDDLKIRLAHSFETEGNRGTPLPMHLRIEMTNAGKEPWFYHDRRPSFKIEVTDSKGQILALNEGGIARMAPPKPKDYNIFSGLTIWLNLLPGDSDRVVGFTLDDYVNLTPGEKYTVRVILTGYAYRSSEGRKIGKNPVKFEVRSAPFVTKVREKD